MLIKLGADVSYTHAADREDKKGTPRPPPPPILRAHLIQAPRPIVLNPVQPLCTASTDPRRLYPPLAHITRAVAHRFARPGCVSSQPDRSRSRRGRIGAGKTCLPPPPSPSVAPVAYVVAIKAEQNLHRHGSHLLFLLTHLSHSSAV